MRLTTNPNFPKIYFSLKNNKQILLTYKSTPGKNIYGESLIKMSGREYRVWDPTRSKYAAAILNGLKLSPLNIGSQVLYLGAAHGTTVSHFSDLIGPEGKIYALEFSERPFIQLLEVALNRPNIIPLLEDVRYPDHYISFIGSTDLIYSDVAQPNQGQIVLENAAHFLKNRGLLFMALKLSSIAYQQDYQPILQLERSRLQQSFHILQEIPLEPFHKKHIMLIAQYNK